MSDTLLFVPSLHCNTSQHFATLHHTSPHFTTLHFTTLIDTYKWTGTGCPVTWPRTSPNITPLYLFF